MADPICIIKINKLRVLSEAHNNNIQHQVLTSILNILSRNKFFIVTALLSTVLCIGTNHADEQNKDYISLNAYNLDHIWVKSKSAV